MGDSTPRRPSLLTRLGALSRWQKLVLVVGLLIAAIDIGIATKRQTQPAGDFGIRREFGGRFVEHQSLYHDLLCFNYMPTFAMYWAPTALVSPAVGSFVHSLVALVCLGLTLRWLHAMTASRLPAGSFPTFTVTALALLLSLHYLIRDLDDAGPHIIWLAMLVGGLYAAWKGRPILSAMSLGLPIAIKITPALVIPMFVWKRQWRLATYTSIATLGWIALPAVWMGPTEWFDAQREWTEVAFSVLSNQKTTERVDNEVRVQNQALKPALMRWLESYPDGHPLKLDHAWDISLFAFSPRVAGGIATGLMVALLTGFAWWSRRKYEKVDDPAMLVEFSAVLLLVLLYSPLTWVQHLVFALPALYLLVAHDRGFRRLSPAATLAVWLFAIATLVLNREVLGKSNYFLLLSYHMHAFCILLVLALVMWVRPTCVAAAATKVELPRGPHFRKSTLPAKTSEAPLKGRASA